MKSHICLIIVENYSFKTKLDYILYKLFCQEKTLRISFGIQEFCFHIFLVEQCN